MRNPQLGAVLRVIVAAYLIYLGVSIMRSSEGGAKSPLLYIFAILFIICGVGYICYSGIMMKRQADDSQTTAVMSQDEQESDTDNDVMQDTAVGESETEEE